MDLTELKKIVVFGGSFDPPHLAHVRLPEVVMRSLGADAVAYVPTAQQPLKRDRQQSPAKHRLAMLKLAITDCPHAFILTEEIDRGGVSYTVDTLEWLWLNIAADTTLRLLIGTDQLRIFHKWRAAEQIIHLAEPVVMVRPPDTVDGVLAELPAGYDAEVWRARLIEVPRMDVSSTAIRQAVRDGKSVASMVPPAVAEYIQRNGLYVGDK